MKRLIAGQRLAYVATVCPDGTPNLSPRGSLIVWDDDHLLYGDLRSPGTTANLRRNPAVEINVVDPLARKGYRFKGQAEILVKGELRDRAIERLGREVTDAGRRVRAVILITVSRALPVTSPAYDLGARESDLVARWLQYYTQLNSGETPERRATD